VRSSLATGTPAVWYVVSTLRTVAARPTAGPTALGLQIQCLQHRQQLFEELESLEGAIDGLACLA
jgi:hypothetical protein